MFRIGIDLGGTKIESVALDKDGKELMRQRVPTPKDCYESVVKAMARQVNLMEEEVGEQALVGVAIPGAIVPSTGLAFTPNLPVNKQPLPKDLCDLLGKDVRFGNDANCFAVSEARDGAAAGAHVVFGAILGTGCGAGIAVDGVAITGRNGIAGEWGHNPLPWRRKDAMEGPVCGCGRDTCNESFISGTGFRYDYQQASGGKDLSGSQIINLAKDGDPVAIEVYERYVDRLARAFAQVINLIDPDVIVCGGGMSNIEALYTDVPPMIPKYTFISDVDTPVRRAKHGDSSGVRGAAWLWSLEELARAEAKAA